MAYNKTNWQSLPSTDTPISTGNLNKMEEGIYQNSISVDTLNENVSNINGIILWTNPDITQDFASQQITLSSSDYDILEFYFVNASSKDNIFTTKTIKGIGTFIWWIINLNPGVSEQNGVRQRNIQYINDTTYAISNCFERPDSGTSIPTIKTDRLIPLYVVGYKTGLFNNV